MGKTAGGYPRVLKDGHMMIWPDVTKEMNDYRRGYLTLQAEVERLKGELAHVEGSEKTLIKTLGDLLNDCINFDGGKLSDCMLRQASDLLSHKKDEGK